LLDRASDAERPIYLATCGILTSPTFLASIIVGVLFEVFLPELVFAAALMLSCVGLVLAWSIPRGDMGNEERVLATLSSQD
jgi:hypothetical protein